MHAAKKTVTHEDIQHKKHKHRYQYSLYTHTHTHSSTVALGCCQVKVIWLLHALPVRQNSQLSGRSVGQTGDADSITGPVSKANRSCFIYGGPKHLRKLQGWCECACALKSRKM